MKRIIPLIITLVLLTSCADAAFFQGSTFSGQCLQGTAFADGCSGAPTGTIQHPTHLHINAVPHAGTAGVGSGYTNGTGYAWTGNGCSVNPTGTVDVVGGQLTNVVVLTEGSGCPSFGEMNIAVPAGAGGGTGGVIQGLVLKVRPPWNVPGVDYYVGPQGTPTIDPASLSVSGLSVNTSTCLVAISGSNVVLPDGVDFTTSCPGHPGSGYAIDITGNNAHLKNFKIAQVPPTTTTAGPIKIEAGVTGTLIEKCTIDGGKAAIATSSSTGILIQALGGAWTLQYCWIKDAFGVSIASTINASPLLQFNLFENTKFCCNTVGGGPHGEFLNAVVGTNNAVSSFNATIQDYAGTDSWPGYLSSVWENAATGANGNISGIVQSNTMSLLYGTAGHMAASGTPSNEAADIWSELHNVSGSDQTLSPVSQTNYLNMSGVNGFMYTCDATTITPTISGNINMLTGAKPTSQGASPCN